MPRVGIIAGVDRLLEKGDISFYVHPKHEHAVTGPEEIDHFYCIWQPENQDKVRLVEISQKKISEVMKGKSSTSDHWWGLIKKTANFKDVWVYLNDLHGAVTEIAVGSYQILTHQQHVDFIFTAKFSKPEATSHFSLQPKNSFILAILNPDQQAPSGFVQREGLPTYADSLKSLFNGKRFLTSNFTTDIFQEQTVFVLVKPKKRLVKAELRLLINEADEQAQQAKLAA